METGVSWWAGGGGPAVAGVRVHSSHTLQNLFGFITCFASFAGWLGRIGVVW